MGKTHFSGLAVGDVATDIFSSVVLAQAVDVPLADAPFVFHFNEPTLLISAIVLTTATGAPQALTGLKLGTGTAGGTITDIFNAATVSTGPTSVMKAVSGRVYVQIASGAGNIPATVILQHAPTKPSG
jgi:hypothetical protein